MPSILSMLPIGPVPWHDMSDLWWVRAYKTVQKSYHSEQSYLHILKQVRGWQHSFLVPKEPHSQTDLILEVTYAPWETSDNTRCIAME